MRKVYLSFLGLGIYDKIRKTSAYEPTVYMLNNELSSKTEFIQVAEIERIGVGYFDKIIIVCTQKSYDAHFDNLEKQLSGLLTVAPSPLIIEEDMSPKGQWTWFENILEIVNRYDELTIDLTHGYRSAPIVISAAINFLQKAKNITLKAVYYGAFEKDRGQAPIVDMKEFYIINEWAEAVSRLVEDADARKMAKTAEQTSGFQFGELNSSELVETLEDLTNMIRNVDINNIGDKAGESISFIELKEKNASNAVKILLKLVHDKFSSLTANGPLTGRYDRNYFFIQIEIIKLLLEHNLFMQAYTVMREFIGSIGMIEVEKANIKNSEGRKKRRRFADVFVDMLQFEENEWKFENQRKIDSEKLKLYYYKIKEAGVETILRAFTKELIDYRNGFDHAWTSKAGAYSDIENRGISFIRNLEDVFEILIKSKIL